MSATGPTSSTPALGGTGGWRLYRGSAIHRPTPGFDEPFERWEDMNPNIANPCPEAHAALDALVLTRREINEVVRRAVRRYLKRVKLFGGDDIPGKADIDRLVIEFKSTSKGKHMNDAHMLDWCERFTYALDEVARAPCPIAPDLGRKYYDVSLSWADGHVTMFLLDKRLETTHETTDTS